MKIAVNTRFLIGDKMEGIGYFTHETMRRITTQHPEHEFIFLFDRKYDDSFIFSENITPLVLPPPARHPFLWYYWFEHVLPACLNKIKPDYFISPDSFLSLRSDIKTILVMHDLAFEDGSAKVPYLTKRYYRYFFPKYARKAERIATVSQFSKQDIIEKYHINPNKIDVVYSAAKEPFRPISSDEKEGVKAQYTSGQDYFIYVGMLQPRKNIERMLKSFDDFKDKTGSSVKLLIAGRKVWGAKGMLAAYNDMAHKEDVVFTDYVSLEELVKLVGASLALLFVSCFEGFGVPILEGMQCEVPVITSNVSSMSEVAADAALIVDPYSIDSITQAMIKIHQDPALRNTLIDKGKIQRENFSWDDTAHKLWEVINKEALDI